MVSESKSSRMELFFKDDWDNPEEEVPERKATSRDHIFEQQQKCRRSVF